MLCKDLEDAVQSSYLKARTERYAFVSVENLLLALLAEVTATRVLRATGADLGVLRSELVGFIDETTPRLGDDDQQTQPTGISACAAASRIPCPGEWTQGGQRCRRARLDFQ